ncbi:MAG: hypothetical protein HZA72_02810, partial [Candidatus Omnitrophica bacterium]|nr:hypothetical protein [Candidatus Omnitrophota bacterium]
MMDATFRAAIVISTIIHSGVFLPFYNTALNQEKLRDKPLVVDYVKVKEPDSMFKEAVRPDIELNKRSEMKAPVEAGQEDAKEIRAKDEARENAKRQARIRSSKDYINYFQLLREKIRQRLKSNYMDYQNEGDVSLAFVLNSDGSLSTVDVDSRSSSQDMTLKRIAIESVKEAAPFPAFP